MKNRHSHCLVLYKETLRRRPTTNQAWLLEGGWSKQSRGAGHVGIDLLSESCNAFLKTFPFIIEKERSLYIPYFP